MKSFQDRDTFNREDIRQSFESKWGNRMFPK